jgi:hypothetical protein
MFRTAPVALGAVIFQVLNEIKGRARIFAKDLKDLDDKAFMRLIGEADSYDSYGREVRTNVDGACA